MEAATLDVEVERATLDPWAGVGRTVVARIDDAIWIFIL